MKNIKAIGLLVLALLTGLAAAVYAASWIAQRGTITSTKVVVAAADLELGTKVNTQLLQVVDWPSGSLPDGSFKEVKDLSERVVKTSVARGEPILERKLAPAGTKGGLSSVIADGKRAMTVRVNDVVGVAGFALPGNYVDVMVNTQQEKGGGQPPIPISMTVLEKVLVLAVAQEASRDDTKPKVVSAVTLELAPGDAEKLDLARSVGTLSLVLRNQLDKNSITTAGITRDQLLGIKQPVLMPVATAAPRPAPAAPRPAMPIATAKGPCVEVIRSGTLAMSCF